MVQKLNNYEGPPGSMQCMPDLPEWVSRGMACEAEVRKGVITWKPCGRGHIREVTRTSIAPVSGSHDHPERCVRCDMDYVEIFDTLDWDDESSRVILELVCNNCGWSGEVRLTIEQDSRLIAINREQRNQVALDDYNCFAMWARRFTLALREGHVKPEDF
ncbi:hypothetical protein EPO04_00035 [Patescibacteria group bacterium]|nr:MAG: hypothetical protein EPO04_00035 [Patescibacteria group bacterium]